MSISKNIWGGHIPNLVFVPELSLLFNWRVSLFWILKALSFTIWESKMYWSPNISGLQISPLLIPFISACKPANSFLNSCLFYETLPKTANSNQHTLHSNDFQPLPLQLGSVSTWTSVKLLQVTIFWSVLPLYSIGPIILAATIGFLTIPYLTPIFSVYVMAAPHFKVPVSEL